MAAIERAKSRTTGDSLFNEVYPKLRNYWENAGVKPEFIDALAGIPLYEAITQAIITSSDYTKDSVPELFRDMLDIEEGKRFQWMMNEGYNLIGARFTNKVQRIINNFVSKTTS